MKLVSSKIKDYGLLNDDFFNTLDFPFFKMGKNMQMLKTDIVETNDQYVLEIDVPGYEKEEINISLDGNYLTISAEKDEKRKASEQNYLLNERCLSGSCSRSFYVGDISYDNVKATFKNGTLILTIPKVKETQEEKKTIAIE